MGMQGRGKICASWKLQEVGDFAMLRTITVGSCVSVQGTFERQLENGKIQVRVGERVFAGNPVAKKAD